VEYDDQASPFRFEPGDTLFITPSAGTEHRPR